MKFQYFFKYIFCFYFILSSESVLSNDKVDFKVKELTLELRCMTCQNQSVYDSDSDFAKDIKNVVKDKFQEGLNQKEIKHFLTERYGEYILFKPYFNTKNLFLWLFPFILLVFSIGFFIKKLKNN
ncbi:cytochrome c-type biogenesis protein CcmH [Pelagibacterales bacterium SAG-MED31]|nr:cytochrome c-type biogenesis protein CcmH [Pelagibacterales bacterium SAG-MED31]